jgi:hypothetical protein
VWLSHRSTATDVSEERALEKELLLLAKVGLGISGSGLRAQGLRSRVQG